MPDSKMVLIVKRKALLKQAKSIEYSDPQEYRSMMKRAGRMLDEIQDNGGPTSAQAQLAALLDFSGTGGPISEGTGNAKPASKGFTVLVRGEKSFAGLSHTSQVHLGHEAARRMGRADNKPHDSVKTKTSSVGSTGGG